MVTQGTISGISRDYESGKLIISFLTDYKTLPSDIDELTGGDALDITAKRHREKRSLNANAYYWQLLNQLSVKLMIPTSELHNEMLRKHPVPSGWFAEIPDTEEAEQMIRQSETFHLKPTDHVREGKYGTNYRTYLILKGSSEYNTKEMSVLIDSLVEECKAQGIETKTPEEIARMMALWGQGE